MERVENGGYSHLWRHCRVALAEGYQSVMMDFHSHDFYEITLILSGNVRSLLRDRSVEGDGSRLVLTAPRTPHLMYLTAPGLYSRIHLTFSREFLGGYVPEWGRLSRIFGRNGSILPLSEEERELCREKMLAVREETDLFRQRLRILEFLSYVAEFGGGEEKDRGETTPVFIMEALSYIDTHYAEKIVAESLARRLGVCRTTLMTSFHRHTGTTLSEYVFGVRIRAAVALLREGVSQERVAEQVGFGNGGGLIRAFRQQYGMTPRQYIKSEKRG